MATQEHTETTEAELRRELAFEANFQINKLAEAMKRMMVGDDDQTLVNAMMSRIEQCTEIVYHCMRLDGLEDDDAGRPDLKSLKRQFEGKLA